jgi:hypothetical protein
LHDAKIELFPKEENLKRAISVEKAYKEHLLFLIKEEKVKTSNQVIELGRGWGLEDPRDNREWSILMNIRPDCKETWYEIQRESRERLAPLQKELNAITLGTNIQKMRSEKDQLARKVDWLIRASEYLENTKSRAARKLADINAKQAEEYLELFPPACLNPDPVPTLDLNVEIMKMLAPLRAEDSRSEVVARVQAEVFYVDAVPTNFGVRSETTGASFDYTLAFSKRPLAKNLLGVKGVDAVQVSSHRGPATDRPPDPPPGAVSVSGWCSLERASTRYPVSQLASSLCLDYSLSSKSSPFAANAIYGVKKPSFCQASSQADSCHEFNRGLSWMPPRCGRSRVKRDTCVTNCHPSSNLGRNLFPRRGFLTTPDSAGSSDQRCRVTRIYAGG